ncbi:hypothetical protein E0J12_14840 [Listeria monocytogenes]|nr:hypothetical protein [Listeria monocytogenes]
MSKITAGIVLKTKFIVPNSPLNKSKQYWPNYIKYIDRDEAVRNAHYKEFSLIGNEEERAEEDKERNKKYIDYMGNPQKTSGLFTEGKTRLTAAEKKKYKSAFQTAQDNNSVMFQHIISFDNDWLAKQGIYDPSIGMLDEKRLQQVTSAAMKSFLRKEEMDGSAIWLAAIHKNTKHFHVHISVTEPNPTRKFYSNKKRPELEKGTDGNPVRDGRMAPATRRAVRSTVYSEIAQRGSIYQRIDDYAKEQLLTPLHASKEVIRSHENEALFLELHQMYKKHSGQWNYGNLNKHPAKKVVDQITTNYLTKHHPEEMQVFQKAWEHEGNLQQEAYGKKTEFNIHTYLESKDEKLYKQLGNQVLQEVKNYDKRFNHSKSDHHYLDQQGNLKKEGSLTPKDKIARYRRRRGSVIYQLKKMDYELDNSYKKWKNDRAFEQLEQEMEREKSVHRG